jgi:AraC-like DNA-binding protein
MSRQIVVEEIALGGLHVLATECLFYNIDIALEYGLLEIGQFMAMSSFRLSRRFRRRGEGCDHRA